MLGLGRAVAITQQDIWEVGQSLGVNPAVIDGIGITESNGAGWFPNGQLKILPEPHVFFDQLPTAAKKAAALKAGLATRNYKETKASGHYKRMTNGPGPRYAFLEKMIRIDENAAYMSISSGSFQIMGFNFSACGFTSAKQMFDAFCESEAVQLKAFVNFIKSKNGGLKALRNEDYQTIETLYNGGGQGGAYARQMQINVTKAKKGRWANYHPSDNYQAQLFASTGKSTPVAELRRGDISPQVEAIQQRLIVWGYDIKPDGKYGPLTEEAVKDFQKDRNFNVTGRVNEETRLALYQKPDWDQAKQIEEAVTPIVVTETKKEAIPVVPKQARKPWWKSVTTYLFGGGTLIPAVTNFLGDLEPWMKFVLLLITIGAIGIAVWQRDRLFKEAKDLVNRVQDFNDNAEPEVTVDDPNLNSDQNNT